MSDEENAVLRVYERLLKLLGVKLGLNQVKILSYALANPEEKIAPARLVTLIGIDRTLGYQVCTCFEKMGILEKLDKEPLPEGYNNWGKSRRSSWRKRNPPSVKSYVLSRKGLMQAIDNRIVELRQLKEWVEENVNENEG